MHSREYQPVSGADAAAAAIAIREGRGRAQDYHLLGWYQVERGDKRGGEAMFREALEVDGHDVIARLSLAGVLRVSGNLRDAALECDAVITADPDSADAWHERGLVMIEGGVPSEAMACFGKVQQIAPDHAGAPAMLALISARTGDAENARRHAQRALLLEPSHPTAHRALAMVALEAGRLAEALGLLKSALENSPQAGAERVSILTLIGEVQDKLSEPACAAQAYAQANAEFAADNAVLTAERDTNASRIAELSRGFAAAATAFPSAWSASAPVDPLRLNPVFVLGHPRSGNTLLENVLATIAGASTLEERPTLRVAEQRFLSKPGMDALAAAPQDELEDLRGAYRQAVIANGGDPDALLLVDMDPLKSLRLPIITRLFPEARVVLVRRDPRDVVWSCYRTHFALSNAALDFVTLEGAARHYAATMDLIETVCAEAKPQLHIVRYEDMVDRFDETTQAVADFLGLAWSANVRNFDQTARSRGVTTASERQVRRGLYDGRWQWKAHAELLHTVEPFLGPWIDRFGYR